MAETRCWETPMASATSAWVTSPPAPAALRVAAEQAGRLPAAPSPVALPVLFRLWRGRGTASQVTLAAELMTMLAGAFTCRAVHGTGDAAFHGDPLACGDFTWTTRLPASAVICGPKPPPAGKGGRPRKKGERIGTCKDAAAAADWQEVTVRIYGKDQKVQAAAFPGLWHCSFGDAPGQLVLMREPDSKEPYDLGLFTLDTELGPADAIERYSWRWPVEPSSAAGKQVTGAGDACNRTTAAVERAVPFAFLVQSLMTCWYAISCDPAAGILPTAPPASRPRSPPAVTRPMPCRDPDEARTARTATTGITATP